MKWFKHMTNAMEDLFIKDLEAEFGDSGYVFWFKTLELLGAQGEAGSMDISENVWRQVIHSKRTDHLRRLYTFATQRGKLKVDTLSNGLLRVKCEKFAEYADNFTRYQKPLKSDFKAPLSQEENRKEEDHIHDDEFSLSLEQHLLKFWGREGKMGWGALSKFVDLIKIHSKEKVFVAIEEAANHNAKSLAYVKGILNGNGKKKTEPVSALALARQSGMKV